MSESRDKGQAGLAGTEIQGTGPLGKADPRWVETALEVMADHTQESKPTKAIITDRIAARLEARHGAGVVRLPSRTSAYRYLEELEHRVPTFSGSSKRRREIADHAPSTRR